MQPIPAVKFNGRSRVSPPDARHLARATRTHPERYGQDQPRGFAHYNRGSTGPEHPITAEFVERPERPEDQGAIARPIHPRAGFGAAESGYRFPARDAVLGKEETGWSRHPGDAGFAFVNFLEDLGERQEFGA
jgi:hypothetical protein